MCLAYTGAYTDFENFGVPVDKQQHTVMRRGKTARDKINGAWASRLANRAAKAQANRDRYGKK